MPYCQVWQYGAVAYSRKGDYATMSTSMYAASQEYYRMNKKTLVAAGYVRNSDPSKKDTEEQQAQVDALKTYARTHGYELPDRLIYRDAISALKYPYWERP